jgi:hypothetical protein
MQAKKGKKEKAGSERSDLGRKMPALLDMPKSHGKTVHHA